MCSDQGDYLIRMRWQFYSSCMVLVHGYKKQVFTVCPRSCITKLTFMHLCVLLLCLKMQIFCMQWTRMTPGGFIQPSVARALIEQQSNVEKGLCQKDSAKANYCQIRPTTASEQCFHLHCW